jgi:hypothetical protein
MFNVISAMKSAKRGPEPLIIDGSGPVPKHIQEEAEGGAFIVPSTQFTGDDHCSSNRFKSDFHSAIKINNAGGHRLYETCRALSIAFRHPDPFPNPVSFKSLGNRYSPLSNRTSFECAPNSIYSIINGNLAKAQAKGLSDKWFDEHMRK